MPSHFDRAHAYVFDAAPVDVYVLALGAPPPTGGVPTDVSKLRSILFDERNTWERERLLHDLGVPDMREGSLDLADRARLEDQLFGALDRQCALYEVRRAPAGPPPAKVEWFAPSKATQQVTPPDKFIRVLLFDSTGAVVPGPWGPPSARVRIYVTDGPVYPQSIAGGMSEVPSIPGQFSDCVVEFAGVADGAEPNPTEIAPARGAPQMASLARGVVRGPTLATRRQLVEKQYFPASLNATNAFQLRRRAIDVIELEHFADGGALLWPAQPPSTVVLNDDAPVVGGADVLRACLQMAQSYSPDHVLLTGHDSDVSQERADGVKALLVGDADSRETWVGIAGDHGSVSDQQAMLAWAATEFGWHCDPGGIDGIKGQKTTAAIRTFQRSYNGDQDAGLFPPANPEGPLAVDGDVGKHSWGAFFDCWQRALVGAENTAAFLVVDDQHQTYPAELARIATGDENRWRELNALNPTMVIPNDGGWVPPQVGQRIFIPQSWDLGALSDAGYQTTPAQSGSAQRKSIASPGPASYGCGTHHLTTPAVDDEDRRAAQRAVEVVFIDAADDVPLVCTKDTADPCTAKSCELYDPREFDFDYLPPDSLLVQPLTFQYGFEVGDDQQWSDAAVLRIVSEDGTDGQVFSMASGTKAGALVVFDFAGCDPGVSYRGEIRDGDVVVDVFPLTVLHQLADPAGPLALAPPTDDAAADYDSVPDEDLDMLRIRLYDVDRQPIIAGPFRLSVGDQSTAGYCDDGWAGAPVPAMCPVSCTLEWGVADDDGYAYKMDVMLDCDSADEAQVDRVLNNLGYPPDIDRDLRVRAFEANFGLPVQGVGPGGAIAPATHAKIMATYNGTLV